MPTLHSLKTKAKRLAGNRPGVDPIGDARRIHTLIGSMAGILGCGDDPTDNEKKGGDGETKG